MHKYFVRVIATCMTASLLTFPVYAKTNGTSETAKRLDVVGMTIQQITTNVKKAQALSAKKAKAAKKKAASEKAEAEKTVTETQTPDTAALVSETQAQTEADSQTYAESEAAYTVSADTYDSQETASADDSSYDDTDASDYYETESVASSYDSSYDDSSYDDTEDSSYDYDTQEVASSSSSYSGSTLNSVNGTVEGPSGTETYYNLDMSGVVSNMQDLGIDGDYWVRDDGVKMYGDYIMVAADLDTHPYGSVVETSLGDAIVVDTGDFAENDSDQLDLAVEW